MTEPGFESGQGSPILTQVYEGMTVYDHTGNKIGTVESVYLGELTETADGLGQGPATVSGFGGQEGSLIEDFARAIAFTEQVPDTLRKRLLRQGFIKLNSSGFFSADRYVMPDQIANVSSDGVMLRVSRDELIKA